MSETNWQTSSLQYCSRHKKQQKKKASAPMIPKVVKNKNFIYKNTKQ